MTDPISDMLTRIRNATRALKPEVTMPYSKIKEGIARILKAEGYVADWTAEGKQIKSLKIKLKYEGNEGVIAGLRRVSTPGLRRYVGCSDIPRVLGGMGTAILSTPRGVLSGREARKQNVGGEVLCFVW